MRVLKKAIAGLLLLIGVPITVLTTLDILSPNTSQDDKSNATAALILLGLPPTAIGGWLVGGLHTDARRRARDRLRTTFFNLVKQGQGRISVFDFSEATELSGDRARQYLDERARTFNATFNVDDDGGLFYIFNLGYTDAQRLLDNATPHPLEHSQFTETVTKSPDTPLDADSSLDGDKEPAQNPPSDASSEGSLEKSTDSALDDARLGDRPQALTYDVLLRSVPSDRQSEVRVCIQSLTQHDAETATKLLKEPLSLVASGLEQPMAEHYRHQLEAAGAAVLVVLPPPVEKSTPSALSLEDSSR